MRHVFEFYRSRPTATGSGKRYIGADENVWAGFRAELLCCDSDGKGGDGDALYLEGDGESLRKALTGLLRILDTVEKIERDRLEKRREKLVADCAVDPVGGIGTEDATREKGIP
jgi:hypothetical protein